MAKPITKSYIADHIAQKAGVVKGVTVQILDELAGIVNKEAKNSSTLPGISKFVVVSRNARIERNPRTEEPIKIPAKRVLKFQIAKAGKDAVMGKK